ncbi:MAG: hypothetical protein ACXWLH_05370 [Candidatus Saccharimonadales bacterium]
MKVALRSEVYSAIAQRAKEKGEAEKSRIVSLLDKYVDVDTITQDQMFEIAAGERDFAVAAERREILKGKKNPARSTSLGVDAYILGDNARNRAAKAFDRQENAKARPSIETVGKIGELTVHHLVLPQGGFVISAHDGVFDIDPSLPDAREFWAHRFKLYRFEIDIVQGFDGSFWRNPNEQKLDVLES